MTTDKITQIILKADEGMYLTNGKTYGKTVILPETANQSEWYEITEQEYVEIVNSIDSIKD